MHKFAFSSLLLSTALVAQGVEVYSNGPLQTGTGTQGPISVLQSLTPNLLTIFGFGAQSGVPNRLVDQFAVNTTMLLDGIEVFGYATGVLTPSCTSVELALFDGNPSTGTPLQLLAGAGPGVNLFTTAPYTVTNTLTGIYRVLDTAAGLTATNRPIQSVRINFPVITLTPGIYYLQFAYAGLNFCPCVTTLNQQVTGDGLQAQGAAPTWVNCVSGAAPGFGQGIPFKLYGVPVTTPGSITNIGGGCSTATFAVEGSPAVGGYVRAEVGNVAATALALIVLGTTNPNAPLFVCGCTSKASLDILYVGGGLGLGLNTSLQIPALANLVGLDLFYQGGQLDLVGASPCNLAGLNFDLTNGYAVHLY